MVLVYFGTPFLFLNAYKLRVASFLSCKKDFDDQQGQSHPFLQSSLPTLVSKRLKKMNAYERRVASFVSYKKDFDDYPLLTV